ncbi:MAG: DegT/DnrJ/EryC1/StrS family aminotransferase [Prosthecobacter sp.]|uniref:DegT/DnrJ/EryC1/StrS family aminotransferase n=1 Tax=Prosthecobacter sp. TaxID=1965333 RepID=UPI0039001F41
MLWPTHSLFPPFPLEDQRQHQAELAAAIRRVLDSGSYILGEEVAAFESEFAAFLGVKHVVGVASGTDAIEVMLRALEIGGGSKVIVPSHAPSAVAAGVARSGAKPVFADIEADTFTLCPESLDAVLRSPAGRGVKAALVVHLYGHPADWANLQQVADEHGILLLEDCAQAHGATWHGRMTGALGTAAAFSFYPTKNLGAIGDAGAVATDDDDLAERLRLIRQYGWRRRYVSEMTGVNSRLDELQAAVLRVKLSTLGQSVYQRRRLAAMYEARLSASGSVTPPSVREGCEHAFHQYVVRCERRDALTQHLHAAGIPAAVSSPVPLHRQPAFHADIALPEAERAAAAIVALPLHPYLHEAAVAAVCDAIERLNHASC